MKWSAKLAKSMEQAHPVRITRLLKIVKIRLSAACAAIAMALLASMPASPLGAQVTAPAAVPSGVPADTAPPSGEVTAPSTIGRDNGGAAPADSRMAPALTIATPPDTAATTLPPAQPVSGTTHRHLKTASVEKTGATDDAGPGAPGGSPFAGFGGASNHGPINIHSDTLNLDYKGNTVLFVGHVHAVQSGSELDSDSLRVMYGKDFHEVQKMFANGNVRMSQGERWATGDHAVLDQAVHTVVLTGSPVVHDGKDQIAGTKITVHLDSGMSDVVDPKAVIFPRDAKSRDNGGGAADRTQSAGSAE